jgi:hypothetical protein
MTEDMSMLGDQLAAALRTHPQAAANALKALVQAARCRAAEDDFAPLRTLADRADAAVDAARKLDITDEQLDALAVLAQQTCVVLACLGNSQGVRDSGYYRAALAHAERLDAMTQETLHLVELVSLAHK